MIIIKSPPISSANKPSGKQNTLMLNPNVISKFQTHVKTEKE